MDIERAQAWRKAYDKLWALQFEFFSHDMKLQQWVLDANCEDLAYRIQSECQHLYLAWQRDRDQFLPSTGESK